MTVLVFSTKVNFLSVISGFAAAKVACQSFVKDSAFSSVESRLNDRPCVASLIDGFSLSCSVSQHPKNFERIVGLRLGLLGFYRGEVFSATGVFHR